MSKKKPKKKQPFGDAPQKKKQRGFRIFFAVATIAAVAVVGVVFYGGERSEEGAKQEKVTSAEPTRLKEAHGDLNKLVGRWLRPDGGYIIEVRSISANGKLDAGYFNPRPINVSRAEASRRGADVRVFVELQDVGYPGSTYTLIYDPQPDVLRGVYFHAGLSQTFDVVFVRTQ
jgi:hypothetical protein